MEYSTISALEYFEGTVANAVLPEALLQWDYNSVTRIKNVYVSCESNRTEKKINQIETKIEYNQIKTTIVSNQIKNRESNRVENGDHQNY